MLSAITALKNQNDKNYLSSIYTDNYALLYGIAMAILHDDTKANDTVTDAMLSLFSLVPKLQAMEEWERVAYLKATVRNAAYKQYNAEKRKFLTECVPIEDILFSLPDQVDPGPEAALLQSEEFAQVRDAIATLPEKDRIVLHLKYAAHLTAQEIMDMTNAPSEAAVHTQLSRARKKVLHLLRNGGRDA